jgi:CRP/FNR family transcriptional regulator, cyclic AMP receptor protein
MITNATLGEHDLSNLVKRISVGEYIYKQGDTGNTMFIIVEGTILLFHRNSNAERLVGTLEAGEIIGEKAILTESPYRRTHTAQAKTETTLLEFNTANLKLIQAKIPDFHLKVLRILSERLDKANELIGILQSTDDLDRLSQYLLYYCHNHLQKTPEGYEITITSADIHHAINLEEERVVEILDHMAAEKILVMGKQGLFFLRDENSLISQLPQVRDRIAA